MNGVRYTVQTVPGGAVSPPMTASEAKFLAISRTNARAERVEWCMDNLSALVPRVTIDAADRDHLAVRVARVKED